MAKGLGIKYSSEELSWIEANCKLPRRDAYKQYCEIFKRDDVKFTNYNSLCKRKGWMTGRTGHYKKGGVPLNKGQKMPYNENSARTQFKKGQLPHNTNYIGHERIDKKDGYVYMCIAETNPWTGAGRYYAPKHRYLWEQKYGKLPEGMALKCLDGNRQNTDPANWEAIPRAALPFLNGGRASGGYDYAKMPKELKPVILTLAKVKAAKSEIRRKTKNH